MSRAMQKDYKGYPTQSFTLGGDAWYYITSRGIELCIPRVPGGAGEIQYTIPWRRIQAAAAHHYKSKVYQAKRRSSRKAR